MAHFVMPIYGIASVDEFEISHVDSLNELIGGVAHATYMSPAYWDIAMATTELSVDSARYLDWRTFLDALRGAKRMGWFNDPKRPFPRNYRKGFAGLVKAGTSTPFTGEAVITSFTNRYTIVISGLPVNFALTRSDYVSFINGDYASLHRLSADVVANGSGVATITVEPRVPAAYTTSAVVQFARPPCSGIIQGKINDRHGLESGVISFRARSIVEWGGAIS